MILLNNCAVSRCLVLGPCYISCPVSERETFCLDALCCLQGRVFCSSYNFQATFASMLPQQLSLGIWVLEWHSYFGLASTQVQGDYGIAFFNGCSQRHRIVEACIVFVTRVVVLHCHIEMFLIGYSWWKVNVWLFLWRSAGAILPMLASCAFLVLVWSSWHHHSVVLV